MRITDLPEISEAWWKKNQPKTLSSNGLGAALKAYEDSRKAAVTLGDGKAVVRTADATFAEGDAALKKLGETIAAVIAKCNPTLHKECKAVLGRYDPLLKAEKVRLAACRLSYENFLGNRIKKTKTAFAEIGKEVQRRIKGLEKSLADLTAIEDGFVELRSDVAAAATSGKPASSDMLRKRMQTEYDAAAKLTSAIVAEGDRTREIVVDLVEENCDPELAQADKEIRSFYERYENQIAPADAAKDKAEARLESIAKIKKATEALLDGQGDLEEEWLDICEGQLGDLHGRQEMIADQLAKLSGEADNLWSDANNYLGAPDAADPRLVPSFGERLSALGAGVAQREKELLAAIAAFQAGRKKYPAFVASSAKFKEVRSDLASLDQALHVHTEELKSVKKKGARAKAEVDEARKAAKLATV